MQAIVIVKKTLNIVISTMSSQDWVCKSCNENNFKYRLKCWKCGLRSSEKAKKLEKNDWVCVCGVINFGKRKICVRCGRSKGNQEKIIDNSIPRAGDWWCPCGEMNFSKRKKCRKCDRTDYNQRILDRPGDWNCGKCHSNNLGFRDICFKCCNVRDNFTQDEKLCVICGENERRVAIIKCGHLCLCDVCSFVMDKCPKCEMGYKAEEDLVSVFF